MLISVSLASRPDISLLMSVKKARVCKKDASLQRFYHLFTNVLKAFRLFIHVPCNVGITSVLTPFGALANQFQSCNSEVIFVSALLISAHTNPTRWDFETEITVFVIVFAYQIIPWYYMRIFCESQAVAPYGFLILFISITSWIQAQFKYT